MQYFRRGKPAIERRSCGQIALKQILFQRRSARPKTSRAFTPKALSKIDYPSRSFRDRNGDVATAVKVSHSIGLKAFPPDRYAAIALSLARKVRVRRRPAQQKAMKRAPGVPNSNSASFFAALASGFRVRRPLANL
jgi:hypothetical protein